LKVDFLTYEFEEGIELSFPWSRTFSLTWDYQEPLDFGNIRFDFEEIGETIFEGSVIWLGEGVRSFPPILKNSIEFDTSDQIIDKPDFFNFIQLLEPLRDDLNLDEDLLWSAIDDLRLVHEYRQGNPEESMHVFLYTPSIGGCCPEEWDWYIIMHRNTSL